jgi:predicted RNA methylase
MKITSYHQNLLADQERLAAFYEAVKEKSKGIVYDLGTGSGVLALWAASRANFVYAVEKDPLTAEMARKNLFNLKNLSLIVDDARNVSFPEKADLIICEMLDTALIDEEQVPVLNSVRKYLKEDGTIIPCGVFHGIELVSLDSVHPIYLEGDPQPHHVLSALLIYDKNNFKEPIVEKVKFRLPIEVNKSGGVSGIKITTFTLLTPDLICGPTPMFNPPLLVPTNHIQAVKGENLILNLSYSMGGGLDTIRAEIERIS